MGRPKGSKNKKEELSMSSAVVPLVVESGSTSDLIPMDVTPKKIIHPLSIDYPSEQLNDMAKKINEIIEDLNG